MQALDLSRDVPRSPFDTLGGFAWLPRLIDKRRAHHAGTAGGYAPYPCAGDQAFLAYFGLNAEALSEVIVSGASDEVIAGWVSTHTTRTPAEARAYAEGLAKPPRSPLVRLALVIMRWKALKARPSDIPASELDAIAKVLAYEEGHPLPGAAPART